MKVKLIKIAIFIAVFFAFRWSYLNVMNQGYKQGLVDGEIAYKNSNRMRLALESAYHYGYNDCQDEMSHKTH